MWYDGVSALSGELKWQSRVNEHNIPWLQRCHSIFLDYHWKADWPADSVRAAGVVSFIPPPPSVLPSCLDPPAASAPGSAPGSTEISTFYAADVFVGIDVWGRGQFGGGQFQSAVAAAVASRAGASIAIFAPAWTLEFEDAFKSPTRYLQRDLRLWEGLNTVVSDEGLITAVAAPTTPADEGRDGLAIFCSVRPMQCTLPWSTRFGQGQGRAFWAKGRLLHDVADIAEAQRTTGVVWPSAAQVLDPGRVPSSVEDIVTRHWCAMGLQEPLPTFMGSLGCAHDSGYDGAAAVVTVDSSAQRWPAYSGGSVCTIHIIYIGKARPTNIPARLFKLQFRSENIDEESDVLFVETVHLSELAQRSGSLGQVSGVRLYKDSTVLAASTSAERQWSSAAQVVRTMEPTLGGRLVWVHSCWRLQGIRDCIAGGESVELQILTGAALAEEAMCRSSAAGNDVSAGYQVVIGEIRLEARPSALLPQKPPVPTRWLDMPATTALTRCSPSICGWIPDRTIAQFDACGMVIRQHHGLHVAAGPRTIHDAHGKRYTILRWTHTAASLADPSDRNIAHGRIRYHVLHSKHVEDGSEAPVWLWVGCTWGNTFWVQSHDEAPAAFRASLSPQSDCWVVVSQRFPSQ